MALGSVADSFHRVFGSRDIQVPVTVNGDSGETLHDGSVVIAAITSCTNTSNPSVMVAAALLARNAIRRGLRTKPWVKTSLAPGSRVVTDYLDAAGLTPYLDQLGFQLVGYGCTTCIGNSGPLPDAVSEGVRTGELAVAAVLSGNRNFEGRIHPQVRASYLASPPLVVAYALAGRVDTDLAGDPLGTDQEGQPVYLHELWPPADEIAAVIEQALTPDLYDREYGRIWDGDERWRALDAPTGAQFAFAPDSTYVREPPFLEHIGEPPAPLTDIVDARCLALVGDSVTTDHISPAGAIPADMPAGRYLQEHGVVPREFNSFGSRRGNHEVMVRGTFGNIRLRNALAEGKEGGYTKHQPSGELMSIYDAAERYASDEVPLVILAGKEYGSGSSRDWAAKGTQLLGVRAVIAESFERIHRSNLVGMGVLPLELTDGATLASLGLTGRERFTLRGLAGLAPRARVTVIAVADDRTTVEAPAIARLDGPADVEYLRHGGILPLVMRRMLAELAVVACAHEHPATRQRTRSQLRAGHARTRGHPSGDRRAPRRRARARPRDRRARRHDRRRARGARAPRASPRARTLARRRSGRGAGGDRRGARGACRVGELDAGAAGRGVPARGGPAGGPVAGRPERGDDARAVEDGAAGRDRLGLRDHRLPAVQRLVRAGPVGAAADLEPGRLEPARAATARRVRVRRQPVQLHGDRREPPLGPRADGQHRGLEAGEHGRRLGAHDDAAAAGRGAAGRRDQPRARGRGGGRRRVHRPSRPRRPPLHGLDRGLPGALARHRAAHRELPHLPARSSARRAARTSSSCTDRPSPLPSRRRWCAAPTSTRDRSARQPRAPTSPRRCGTASSSCSPTRSGGSAWETWPISATSWAP